MPEVDKAPSALSEAQRCVWCGAETFGPVIPCGVCGYGDTAPPSSALPKSFAAASALVGSVSGAAHLGACIVLHRFVASYAAVDSLAHTSLTTQIGEVARHLDAALGFVALATWVAATLTTFALFATTSALWQRRAWAPRAVVASALGIAITLGLDGLLLTRLGRALGLAQRALVERSATDLPTSLDTTFAAQAFTFVYPLLDVGLKLGVMIVWYTCALLSVLFASALVVAFCRPSARKYFEAGSEGARGGLLHE